MKSVPQGNSDVVSLWSTGWGERLWRLRMDDCSDLVFSADVQFVLCSDCWTTVADCTVKTLRASDRVATAAATS